VEALVTGPAVDDVGALSPDGSTLAFVSTRGTTGPTSWLLNLRTRRLTNLTGTKALAGDPDGPDCQFRPQWSPDGRWIAFSSDRNTVWRGHDDGVGWEHTQELSVYVIRPDGTGFRQVATRPGYCLGSPKWSPDGRRIVFYELTTEDTYNAHRPQGVGTVVSQIVSVDVATGERVEHTSGPGLKVSPQFVDATDIGYLVKYGASEGLAYTSGSRPPLQRALRSPAWSPDGEWIASGLGVWFQENRPQNMLIRVRSDGSEWEQLTDATVNCGFPAYSAGGRHLVYRTWSEADHGLRILDLETRETRVLTEDYDNLPDWSPDGKLILFTRRTGGADFDVCTIRPDGSGLRRLTTSGANDAHAVWNHDGRILYNSGMFGFREEAALYDDTFQSYGQIFVMNADGSGKRMLTDSLTEDSMPRYLPNKVLRQGA
jgi:Tol biopolymer transport system component